jgi:hypothetical protein
MYMSSLEFPEKGILWRDWNDETLGIIREKNRPALLFVADSDPLVAPFLKAIFKAMPANEKLRGLLHELFPAVLIKADSLPEDLKLFGAGIGFHIAVLSPAGFTPMITFDPVSGSPEKLVDEIVAVLERLRQVWS